MIRLRTRRAALTAAAAVLGAVAYGLGQIPASAATDPPAVEVREVFSPDGSIGTARIPVADLPRTTTVPLVQAEVVTIQRTGTPQTRFDLVFVGDGYTAAEQELFHSQAVARWEQLIAVEPFRSLRDKFNVWQVNAVSAESGSDHDPVQGVQRDTALHGGFWCGGLDRLVCVDETATTAYAALAPGADEALVLVNSATYGGSGGSVTVSSGGNAVSGDIVPHELGHSIAGLAVSRAERGRVRRHGRVPGWRTGPGERVGRGRGDAARAAAQVVELPGPPHPGRRRHRGVRGRRLPRPGRLPAERELDHAYPRDRVQRRRRRPADRGRAGPDELSPLSPAAGRRRTT